MLCSLKKYLLHVSSKHTVNCRFSVLHNKLILKVTEKQNITIVTKTELYGVEFHITYRKFKLQQLFLYQLITTILCQENLGKYYGKLAGQGVKAQEWKKKFQMSGHVKVW